MKQLFSTPSFHGSFEKGQPLHQLLISLPGCSEDKLNTESLVILGLVWCAGNLDDKAQGLMDVVNPPGQAQDSFAANDKDLPGAVEKLVNIQTIWTLKQCKMFAETKNPDQDEIPEAEQLTNVFKYGLSSDEEDQEKMKQAVELMQHSEDDDPNLAGFTWALFGYEPKFTNAEYMKEIEEKKNRWIFLPMEARLKMDFFLADGVIERL